MLNINAEFKLGDTSKTLADASFVPLKVEAS
jgi:hypothetical protein